MPGNRSRGRPKRRWNDDTEKVSKANLNTAEKNGSHETHKALRFQPVQLWTMKIPELVKNIRL